MAVLGVAAAGAVGALDLSSTELTKVTNKVEVRKGAGAFKPVPANLQLAGGLKRLDAGDKVKTAAQSGAELVLKETCVLGVKERTLFEVPPVLGAAALGKLKAQQGSLLLKVVTGSDFKVQTADVVAGVKGTLFEVDVVDDLRTVLDLPNLEIGLPQAGGTTVEVYEGEVELTHTATGRSRRLRAGEALAALGRKLLGLDGSLAEGFGPVRRFQPLERLRQRFGAFGEALGAAPSTKLGFAGLQTAGAALPLRLESAQNRLGNLVQGLAGPLQERIQKIREGAEIFQGLRQNLQEIKGVPFVPSFKGGAYRRVQRSTQVPPDRVEEAWLGDGLFVAMAADGAGGTFEVAPADDGLRLANGAGSFRIRDYIRDIEGSVSCRATADGVTTLVELTRGELLVRIPGELQSVTVAPGKSYAVSAPVDGSAAPRSVPFPGTVGVQAILAQHTFAAEDDVARQKEQHEKATAEKRQKAVEKTTDAVREAVKDKGKNLKNIGKSLRGIFGR